MEQDAGNSNKGQALNAFLLRGSESMKFKDQLPGVYRSEYGGYVIESKRADLLKHYQDRYQLAHITDQLFDEPEEVQPLISKCRFKRDLLQKKQGELRKYCSQLGVEISDIDVHSSNDYRLKSSVQEIQQIQDEIDEFERQINSIKHPSPREWPDPIPLPDQLPAVMSLRADMLPDVLYDYIADEAERMQCAVDYIAIGFVVSIASLIAGKIGIYPKAYDTSWFVRPNLWGMAIGRPSKLKSPALEVAKRFLDRLKDRLNSEHEVKLRETKQQAILNESKIKSLKKDLQCIDAGSDEAVQVAAQLVDLQLSKNETVLRRLYIQDSTVAKLGEILSKTMDGILVFRDELQGWLKKLDAYGNEGDRSFWIEGWSGNSSFDIDRIGRGTVFVPRNCISVLGSIQPGPLGRYVSQATMNGLDDDGLIQRFQVSVYPDHRTWRHVDRAPSTAHTQDMQRLFEKLCAFGTSGSELDKLNPGVQFSSDAQNIADEYRAALEKQLESDLSPAVESHLGKYRSLFPSLALIFQVVTDQLNENATTAVGKPATLMACRWCKYLESHAARIYHSAIHARYASAKELLRKIKKREVKQCFVARDVYRNNWTLLDVQGTKQAIEYLLEFDILEQVEVSTTGRTRKELHVNPKIYGGKDGGGKG